MAASTASITCSGASTTLVAIGSVTSPGVGGTAARDRPGQGLSRLRSWAAQTRPARREGSAAPARRGHGFEGSGPRRRSAPSAPSRRPGGRGNRRASRGPPDSGGSPREEFQELFDEMVDSPPKTSPCSSACLACCAGACSRRWPCRSVRRGPREGSAWCPGRDRTGGSGPAESCQGAVSLLEGPASSRRSSRSTSSQRSTSSSSEGAAGAGDCRRASRSWRSSLAYQRKKITAMIVQR